MRKLQKAAPNMQKTLRLIFLGAGFSQPAGLPLGDELFKAVRRSITAENGPDNHVENDLKRYVKYINDCEGTTHTVDTIDYEQFLGFLDVEHYLKLKGKDTWSDEGNESQLMVRQAIARVLLASLPEKAPLLYREFAKRLNPSDMILTFNYDTLLESALEEEGIPYRLFPDRDNDADNSEDEVVVLKMHGSINWFDRSEYERHLAYAKTCAKPYAVPNPIFADDRIVTPTPLTDEPRNSDDHLAKIYQVRDIRPLLSRDFWECCPLILAPSRTKILYAQPLIDFWWGLQRIGGLQLAVSIVGYSLPAYDTYVRQALYPIFRNYTEFEPDLKFNGRQKCKIRILDHAKDSGAFIRSRYRFADWNRTELNLDGFNENSLNWLMKQELQSLFDGNLTIKHYDIQARHNPLCKRIELALSLSAHRHPTRQMRISGQNGNCVACQLNFHGTSSSSRPCLGLSTGTRLVRCAL